MTNHHFNALYTLPWRHAIPLIHWHVTLETRNAPLHHIYFTSLQFYDSINSFILVVISINFCQEKEQLNSRRLYGANNLQEYIIYVILHHIRHNTLYTSQYMICVILHYIRHTWRYRNTLYTSYLEIASFYIEHFGHSYFWSTLQRVKPTHDVTSIKQESVVKGHLCRIYPYRHLY